jgi:hypothetical protein
MQFDVSADVSAPCLEMQVVVVYIWRGSSEISAFPRPLHSLISEIIPHDSTTSPQPHPQEPMTSIVIVRHMKSFGKV